MKEHYRTKKTRNAKEIRYDNIAVRLITPKIEYFEFLLCKEQDRKKRLTFYKEVKSVLSTRQSKGKLPSMVLS